MASNRLRYADRSLIDGTPSSPGTMSSRRTRAHHARWTCVLGALLLGSSVAWAVPEEVPAPAPEAIWGEVAEYCAGEVEAVVADSSRPPLCTRLTARGRQLECVSKQMLQRSDPSRHAGLERWAGCLQQVAQPLTSGWYVRPAEIDRRVEVCNGAYVSAADLAKPAITWLGRAMRWMEFRYWLEPAAGVAPVRSPPEAPGASRVRTPASGSVQCDTLLAQSNVPQYINMPNAPLASVQVELPESRPGAPAPIVMLPESGVGKKGKRATAETGKAAPADKDHAKDGAKKGADAPAEKADDKIKADKKADVSKVDGRKLPARVQTESGR